MTEEENCQERCGHCGQKTDSSQLVVDEDSGMLLCPACLQDQEACGCSDGEE